MTSLHLQDLGLKPTQMTAVARRAKKEGTTPAEYVRKLVERDLLTSSSFDDVLRPMRAGFQAVGVTEDELDTLVTRARKAVHARRKSGK